jgi:VanZ family protein
MRGFSLWGPVAVYMAAIFFVSAQPDAGPPSGVSDVSAHAVAYLLLGILVVRALVGGLPARVSWADALAAVVICTLYGVTDEFHQSFVPQRMAEVRDIYADAVGASVGAALCWAWGIIAARPRVPRGGIPHDV